MRYISFNYSSLDRFRQAILVSYMVNVGLRRSDPFSYALRGSLSAAPSGGSGVCSAVFTGASRPRLCSVTPSGLFPRPPSRQASPRVMFQGRQACSALHGQCSKAAKRPKENSRGRQPTERRNPYQALEGRQRLGRQVPVVWFPWKGDRDWEKGQIGRKGQVPFSHFREVWRI